MGKCIYFTLMLILQMHLGFAQVYSGSIVGTDPTFNRPQSGEPPTGLSIIGSNVYYHVLTVPVSIPGNYTFTSSSATFDNFGVLYNSSGFDPLNPLSNSIESNDDGAGVFDFEIEETLAIGTYYLVVTAYADGDFGDYTITTTGPASISLPLKLLNFNADKNNTGTAFISWATAEESDMSYFEIEKSKDGKNYFSVAKTNAKSNNNKDNTLQNNYSVIANLDNGINIFRLKMVDYFGKVTYSMKKVITETSSDFLSFYPNPANEKITLDFNSNEEGIIYIKIYDLTGKLHFTEQKPTIKGSNKLIVNTANLERGNYIFHYKSESVEKLIKFEKQ